MGKVYYYNLCLSLYGFESRRFIFVLRIIIRVLEYEVVSWKVLGSELFVL